jgi:C4-dicarboxylate-specific signal transduction histidine kinase/ActR/RegA family two-component response regulator
MRRRPSVRRLIAVGAAAIAVGACLAILSVALISSRSWYRVQRQTETVLDEQANAERIVRQAQDQVMMATYYLRDPRPLYADRFRTRGDEVFQNLRRYLFRDLSARERAEVELMKTAHQEMEGTAILVFDLVRRGDEENAHLQINNMVTQSQQLRERMERFMALRRERLESLKASHLRMMREMYLAMGLLAAISLVIIVLFTRTLQRRLLRPLGELSQAAAQLGAGDLRARVPVARPDELGAVGESFNQMADRLEGAREELESRNRQLADALETLRKTQQEVVQTEKLTALGGMLAGLAHELNNPLASVLGYAEMLQDHLRGAGDERVRSWERDLAGPLVGEALRARDLVRNLLHFSRSAGSTLGPVAMDDALQVAVNLRKYSFAQVNLSIQTEVEAGLWVVAEGQRLQQVFLNLINNAYDALTHGGGTTLWIRAAVAQDPELVEITLEDDGPGLAEPERVFDPFYTTKPVGQGTGLGLSLVHRMVTDFGGTIEASNRARGGACFVIRLRRTSGIPSRAERLDAPQDSAARMAASAHALLTRSRNARLPRVLVVDDEEPIRNLQRRLLGRLGVEVVTAASGTEARDLLIRERISLIIADVKMPGEMSGVELYRWVEREMPQLADRFLFVTGDIADAVVAELGVHDRCLAKPFQTEEYISFVQRLLPASRP